VPELSAAADPGVHAPSPGPADPRPASTQWRPGLRLLLLWSAVGLVVAVTAVALGGAAPAPPPPGLPDPGSVPGWSLPLVRLTAHAAALAVVGALLAALLSGRAPRRGLVAAAAVVWVGASVAGLLLGLSEVVARPVRDVLREDLLRFYGWEVSQGRALLLSAGFAALLVVVAPLLRGRTTTAAALLLALVALTPPLVTGHTASEGSHRLAQVALVAHVLAAVLWVGGLAALALLRRSSGLATAAARFSPLALGCAIAVGGSGAVSAYLRLEDLEQLWTTGYGVLLMGKSVALVLLVGAGAAHRRRTLPALASGSPQVFRSLAVGEVAVMAAAFGLAVALSRTPLG